jgi:hypothetical protein
MMNSAATDSIGQPNFYVHSKDKNLFLHRPLKETAETETQRNPHYRLNVKVMLIINVRTKKA